jgi:CrcB protein
MIKQIILVGFGGGIGSIFRFLTSYFTVKSKMPFYSSTLIVNISGCLLIGFLAGLVLKQSISDTNMRLLLMTGFCGGFTTFSAFSLENMQMWQNGNYITMSLYILSSIILGFAAVGVGLYLAK